MNARRVGQTSRGRRVGEVFSVRVTAEQRAAVEARQLDAGGPRALGPWLLWNAINASSGSTAAGLVVPGQAPPPPETAGGVVPHRARQPGTTGAGARVGTTAPVAVVPEAGITPPRPGTTPTSERVILDLCGGCGAWSAPYRAAGYNVQLVTLPGADVRGYQPPPRVWGVLAAPPCEVFSLARVSERTDAEWLRALEVVLGCLRVVALCRPVWWALENPTGHLGEWLGAPRDVFQPYEFGDAWTKRTSLWGCFQPPARGPYVEPLGGMDGRTDDPPGSTAAARRAVTPPGFAGAFARANP